MVALALLLALALPAGANLPLPAPAAGANATAVAPNQATNNQTSSGVINQAPVGGVNTNIQQNNTQGWPYGFGPGIQCPSPTLALGGFGTGAGGGYGYGNFGYGLAVALVVPLNGRLASACERLGDEVARQRQLDTAINLARACAKLQQERIEVDLGIFPELERCRGVSLTPKP